jgi:ABC-type spermidine/putrescine transport system permease subunit II
VSPKINALATIIILLVSAGILVAGLLMARQNRKKRTERLNTGGRFA